MNKMRTSVLRAALSFGLCAGMLLVGGRSFAQETPNAAPAATEMKSVTLPIEGMVWGACVANFDRALDARYCVYKGALWAAFIHPLAELSEAYFESGVEQVVTLAETFGTTYNSGAFIFGGGEEQAPSPGPNL